MLIIVKNSSPFQYLDCYVYLERTMSVDVIYKIKFNQRMMTNVLQWYNFLVKQIN